MRHWAQPLLLRSHFANNEGVPDQTLMAYPNSQKSPLSFLVQNKDWYIIFLLSHQELGTGYTNGS